VREAKRITLIDARFLNNRGINIANGADSDDPVLKSGVKTGHERLKPLEPSR
jgi:hypothetical protein